MTIAIYCFLAVGLIFSAIGTLGVHRMPDVYGRLQASTCIASLGTICVVVAGVLYACSKEMGVGTYVKLGLLLLLILCTNPIANHALCRAAYKMGVKPAKSFVIDDYKEDEAE